LAARAVYSSRSARAAARRGYQNLRCFLSPSKAFLTFWLADLSPCCTALGTLQFLGFSLARTSFEMKLRISSRGFATECPCSHFHALPTRSLSSLASVGSAAASDSS